MQNVKLMKKSLILIFLIIATLFSSCSESTDIISNMLIPPSSNTEMKKIKDKIRKIVGSDITFISPISGNIRNAINFVDIDLDGINEVVAIYTTAADKMANIIILKKTSSDYQEVAAINTLSNNIDLLEFSDWLQDGKLEMAVGYAVPGSESKGLTIYDLGGTGVTEILNKKYTAISFNDFKSEDYKSIFIVLKNENDFTATGKYIKSIDGTLKIVSECKMNRRVKEYSNITSGMMNDVDVLVFSEIIDDTTIETEIVAIIENELVNYTLNSDGSAKYEDILLRKGTVFSQDIDDDGEIEIPLPVPISQKNITADTVRVYQWCIFRPVNNQLSSASFPAKFYTVMNTSERYYIIYHMQWLDRVNVKQDATGSIMNFYYNNPSHPEKEELMFSVIAFSPEDYKTKNNDPGYSLILSTTERVYASYIPPSISSEAKNITPTAEEIETLFVQKTLKQR